MAINISCHENLQTYWNSLQKMLKSVRMACGLTQDDIAAALNINRVTYTNYERVITFQDIDTVHQRPRGTASRNFRENRDKFIEGVDFFFITPDEFRRAIGEMDSRQQNNVTVLTESDYLMAVKSLHDDLA